MTPPDLARADDGDGGAASIVSAGREEGASRGVPGLLLGVPICCWCWACASATGTADISGSIQLPDDSLAWVRAHTRVILRVCAVELLRVARRVK